MSIFKKNNHINQMIYSMFPSKLKNDVKEVINILPLTTDCIHENKTTYFLNNEELQMYSRVYFDEPIQEEISKLTSLQKTILTCLYTRHNNGYLREKKTILLIDSEEYFVVPFLFQLIGELVFEILLPIKKSVKNNIKNYAKFREENPKYWNLTKSRMISYWNEYYRREYENLKKYTGYEIVKQIEDYKTYNKVLERNS